LPTGGLDIVDHRPTGSGKTHPHVHWLTCGDGHRAIVPNVFKGIDARVASRGRR
jgi:hypothetical protein